MLSSRAHELGPTFMAQLAELTPAAMLLFDRELQPLDCNPAFIRLTGRDAGDNPLECLEESELLRVTEALGSGDAEETIRWPGRVRGVGGQWREVEFMVVRVQAYSLLVMLDVTDSRRLSKKLEALSRFSGAVMLSKSVDSTLDQVAAQVVEATEAVAAVVLMIRPKLEISHAGRAGVPDEFLEAAFELLRARKDVPGLRAFESGQTVVVSPEQKDEFLSGSRLGRLVEREGWRHLVCVPMGCGVINCFFEEELLPTPDDVSFLETLGRFAAVAIENARLFAEAEQRVLLEERQRLGRELHDSVSQSLYSIGLGAQAALAAIDAGSENDTRQTVDYILSLAQAGLGDMRSLLFKLRPEALEDEGLVAALKRLTESSRVRYGQAVMLDLGEEPDLEAPVRHAVYRIAGEAIHNAQKHSGATRLNIALRNEKDTLLLKVADNGDGFDPEAPSNGFGLTSMRERSQEVGGTLSIDSTPGGGTRLTLRVPLGTCPPR